MYFLCHKQRTQTFSVYNNIVVLTSTNSKAGNYRPAESVCLRLDPTFALDTTKASKNGRQLQSSYLPGYPDPPECPGSAQVVSSITKSNSADANLDPYVPVGCLRITRYTHIAYDNWGLWDLWVPRTQAATSSLQISSRRRSTVMVKRRVVPLVKV